jgi:demethylmenaquinone methyltransferase/2-methoxy-6-polyprenyl-1,4-benzoquinol methylase
MTAGGAGRIASYFDRCAHEGRMVELAEEESSQLADCLRRWRVEPGMRVLEPGCGAGRFTEPLARAVAPDGLVVACDLSPAMLVRARRRPLAARGCVTLASAGAVPVRSAWFDRVLLINVLPHLIEPETVLAELRRVLAPGGALWIHHFLSREALNALHGQLESPVCDHQLAPASEVATVLADVGFTVRRAHDDTDGYSIHATR